MGYTDGKGERRSEEPDYTGYEAAKRELRDLSPQEYQEAVKRLAERLGV